MSTVVGRGFSERLTSRLEWPPLAIAILGLSAGGLLHEVGVGTSGNVIWLLVTAVGAAQSLVGILQDVRRGQWGVDVIALLALVGSATVREYLAGAVISLMLASGRALEGWADGQAKRALGALLERAPKSAHRYRGDALETVPLEEVRPGDLLMVSTGEIVPVDCRLESGPGTFDESALTGESLPVARSGGDEVRSGVVNCGAPVDVRAVTDADDSTYAGVVRLVAQAEHSRAPIVLAADRFALVFLFLTLLVAGVSWIIGGPSRAVAVLVVATPCPLILAAPIAQVAGISRAARRGVIVKSGAVLERLARCTTLLIDKTGTVTIGHPVVTDVVSAGSFTTDDILRDAASLDQDSPHVVAGAVVRAAVEHGCQLVRPVAVVEQPGQGIRGRVDGRDVAVGSARWAAVEGTPPWARSARRRARVDGALAVFVAVDGAPEGVLILRDPLRHDAARTLRSLRQAGFKRVVMVTGDRSDVAESVGAMVGVDQVLAERSPQEKLDAVRRESILAPTMMVGDGINDAPALALADVGVALGARGSTAASESADVVLNVDRLDRLSEVVWLARRTRRITLQSITAGMALSLGAMVAAALGLLPVIAGALLQEAIDVAVILNALRALGASRDEARLPEESSRLARRFQEEHVLIRADIDRLREVADAIGSSDPGEALRRVRAIHQMLLSEVVPHEVAEEDTLYPALERFLGGNDPLATMSRAHVEIVHQVRRLGSLLDDIGPGPIDAIDEIELRSALYGIYAILRLHTDQEDESYLSLGDDVAANSTR